ncbi:polysaccharide deacetylase [Mycolicibacterium canariasense]|uniref:Polysaccharide deacetylase n=1 Tax=Mycolicibacterium canariasense TaxID=228230 RepID=A0A117IBG4_MYCCR|nr:polysaccharide deacetylase family protein [Mycolicibacterium canariasense]MCV7212491.1 polysaccharide deacetylase family protein [Mycolicibacterium canariasense]ORV15459.1 polysaccharide deacetylase [Mycolicibacterium canariasense]GAS97935.1 polysaccharide deacetylase [Mycolicibacterium canariasense]
MKLPSHNRFGYQPITQRPSFNWPGGRQLAVYVAVALEHFSYDADGLGLSYSPGLRHPNTYNWAWREYGNRVGGYRLLDELSAHGMPLTVLLNTACYDHCPQLVTAYRQAGAEFVGHGITNSVHPNEQDEQAEIETIRAVRDAIAAHEGNPPAGWMSPGAHPSRRTEDILAREGFGYTLDWPMDDQPTWMDTLGGPLLSVPYPHEVNDVPAVALHHASGADFATIIGDTFDEMREQARSQPLVLGIVIHSFIVGQPFRLRRFREVLTHLTAGHPDVWLTTPGQIARHFTNTVPPERS